MNQKPIEVQMVVKLMNDSISKIHKEIDILENLPNYHKDRNFQNDVIHLQGRIEGLRKIKEKIDILF